jgi:uncharacterized membrane protein YobD (UPF0266 family)
MKVFSALILFCFLQTLMCDSALNTTFLFHTYNNSLKYIKAFHPSPLIVKKQKNAGTFSLYSLSLDYADLTSKNAQFKVDEFGVLHIKYSNLKLTLKGSLLTSSFRKLKNLSSFTATLSNVTFEFIYGFTSKELSTGKREFKFGLTSETPVSFKISKFVTAKTASSYYVSEAKLQITKIDFTPLKNHFKKINQLIFDEINPKKN